MERCEACLLMASEPNQAARRVHGMVVDICVEREPIGKRYTRARCLECEAEWLRVELTAAPWTESWVEG